MNIEVQVSRKLAVVISPSDLFIISDIVKPGRPGRLSDYCKYGVDKIIDEHQVAYAGASIY
jgi:hypothetical protein